VETVLGLMAPGRIVVYGVALDVCDAYVIEGLLSREAAKVILVRDAAHAIRPEEGERLVAGWEKRGVEVRMTAEILAGAATPRG